VEEEAIEGQIVVAQSKSLSEALEEFRKSMVIVAQKFNDSVILVVEAAVNFAEKFHNYIREQYLAAGAPYGDTNEGMMRWLNERSEQAQKDFATTQKIEREKQLEEIRASGREMGRQLAAKGVTLEEWRHQIYG
jgi:hypothetical protein